MVAPISKGSIEMGMVVGLERAQSLPLGEGNGVVGALGSVRAGKHRWWCGHGGRERFLLGCVELCCITSGLAVLICSFSSGSRNRISTDSALLDI